MVDALLLQPPPGDLTGPYPALPYLKSYAQRAGYDVRIRDLGIEAFHFLKEEESLRRLLKTAAGQRKALEKRPFLDPDAQRRFGLLASVLGLELEPELLTEALAVFRDEAHFFDYPRYQKACRHLKAFFRLLSAVHFPTQVTSSDYPRAWTLGSWAKVWEHQNPELNPYAAFYEKVLFPQIEADPPLLIGISMVFGAQSVQALVLGLMIKKRFPDIHLTMGGAYFSQWVLNMGKNIWPDLFSCIDSAICGEGEKPLCRLLDRLKRGGSLEAVPNIIYPFFAPDDFHIFSEMEYTDVTTQPAPDFSDLDMESYLIPRIVIPYGISRGCYWGRCVFCQNRYGDRQVRRYQTVPVDKAVAEMSDLARRYRTDHVNFSNDVIDPAYLKKISQALLDSGLHLVWNTDLRAEKAFTRDLCGLMAKAGLNSVAIGFESGCDRTLKFMDKGIEVQTTGTVMENLYQSGVATQAMGIFGFPGESVNDGLETVRFLEDHIDQVSFYVMGLLMVLPGSLMFADPRKYGVDSIRFENNALGAPEPVWRSGRRMSVREVNHLYQRLSRLESVYALDEYPFVGALSTNHSFLYFEKGPDILKRLRREEQERHFSFHRILDPEQHHRFSGDLKNVVPRFPNPHKVYRSPFPLERIPMEAEAPVLQDRLPSGPGGDYLIDSSEMPISLGVQELALIRRIDGRRDLESILRKVPGPYHQSLPLFFMYLLQAGLIDIKTR